MLLWRYFIDVINIYNQLNKGDYPQQCGWTSSRINWKALWRKTRFPEKETFSLKTVSQKFCLEFPACWPALQASNLPVPTIIWANSQNKCLPLLFLFLSPLPTPIYIHMVGHNIYGKNPNELLANLIYKFPICSVSLKDHVWDTNTGPDLHGLCITFSRKNEVILCVQKC